MSAAHTPGPWSVHDTGEDYRPFAIYSGHQCVADVNSMDVSAVLPSEAANAFLIAASPDMLVALCAAENWFAEMQGGPDTGVDELLVLIRGAVNKAKRLKS